MSVSAQEKFESAVAVIRSLPKEGPFQPSNNMKLTFYALFKQATEGPCNQPKPSWYDVVNKAKWDAWNNLGDMAAEKAMGQYVEELKSIIEVMPQTDVVEDFTTKLDNFWDLYLERTAHGDQPEAATSASADESARDSGAPTSADASPSSDDDEFCDSREQLPESPASLNSPPLLPRLQMPECPASLNSAPRPLPGQPETSSGEMSPLPSAELARLAETRLELGEIARQGSAGEALRREVAALSRRVARLEGWWRSASWVVGVVTFVWPLVVTWWVRRRRRA